MRPMSTSILPGLLVLHGNRLENLGAAVFEWLKRYPLAPLEEAVFLVQSNSIAEWLKMSLALETGICAATRVQLPSQFFYGSATAPHSAAMRCRKFRRWTKRRWRGV